jgi:surface carbohydrate biosynthesis protein
VLPTERGGRSENPTPLTGVDLYLSWNRQDSEWANEHHDIEKDSIEVVGCPRYDLFAEDNRLSNEEIIAARQKYDIPSEWDNPVITIASSFPPADHFLYNKSGMERRKSQNEEFGWRESQMVSEIAETKHKAREKFIELIQQIKKKHPDVWVALKIHPDERVSRYTETVADLDRFSIVTGDYSARFLQTSDLHIHHDCSTGIEAFMLGVPSVDFLPYQFDQLEDSDKGKGSLKAESISEILGKIHQIKEGTVEIPDTIRADGEEYVESQFTVVDGNRAETIAEVIDERLSEASVIHHEPQNTVRRQLYTTTSIDLFRDPDKSLLQYGKNIPVSIFRALVDRPTQTGRPGGKLPQLLSNQLSVNDVREVEELMNLPMPDIK